MARATKTPRLNNCNVVMDVAGRTRLWSFARPDARPIASTEVSAEETLPPKVVGKGWAQLVRPSMNIAWLADQPVFLQLVHLPTDDPSEIPAMLELQIEKLSPLPVAQVVWAWEILPGSGASAAGISLLLLVAERSGVEGLLARLERRGCDADRVESPILQLVAGTRFAGDGAYVFLSRMGGRRDSLIGWVRSGSLCSLSVVHVADGPEGARQLVVELNRLAWAGEVEGWSSGLGDVHLVTDPETAAAMKESIEAELGSSVEVITSPPEAELARAGVMRTFAGEPRANLLPSEFQVRYKQQFTDRLWMGGLVAVLGAYLVGVLIYFGVVEVQKYRQSGLADVVAQLNRDYMEALRLKAQAQVMQETVNLRYAALDCWLAAVEVMPDGLALEKLAFSGGQSLQIEGTVPTDQDGRITDFWKALKVKTIGGNLVFSDVQLRPTARRVVQGVPMTQWSFNCRLQRSEI
ncbi:MAG: hypothetical protein AB7O66_20525 [Limisphaerales bacterium]